MSFGPIKQESAVKLPPVKGYKLDQLGLTDYAETIVKKQMESSLSDTRTYKNPRARKMLQNIENRDYGNVQRGTISS